MNKIFRNFGWNDNVKSFFCIVGMSWMGWGWVEWHWHMGMSYLTSLNTQLFKNITYVGSFGHYPVQIAFTYILLSSFFRSLQQCYRSFNMFSISQQKINFWHLSWFKMVNNIWPLRAFSPSDLFSLGERLPQKIRIPFSISPTVSKSPDQDPSKKHRSLSKKNWVQEKLSLLRWV